MRFDKRVIKVYIMCYENAVFKQAMDFFSDLLKPWCISNHFIRNAGHCLDKIRNRLSRIDQCGIMIRHLLPVK